MLPLVVIIGPTAVGKTKLGVELGKKLGGEVISGDSMQIYRGMDIGTAKIRPEETEGIPHHLIDIKNPDEPFSVADFQTLVQDLINQIIARGHIPILVGGTGLYVQAIVDSYVFAAEDRDEAFRAEMLSLARERGNEYLHALLEQIDAEAAKKIHMNNTKRVIRALEYYRHTGKPISENNQALTKPNEKYQTIMIGLTMEREKLYERINQRVDQMLEEGLVEEVRSLLKEGFSPELPALQGLGYRQIVNFLTGEYGLEKAVELIKRDTRHFAKRQLTWFRRDPRINWYRLDLTNDFSLLVQEIITLISRTIDKRVE